VGIRETLKARQSLSIAIACIAIVGAAIAIFVQARNVGSNPGDVYFTTDDGQTFFAGDGRKFPPFEIDGKTAYRAHVFECKGKRVVGYMSRYTPEALKLFEEARAARAAGKPPANVAKLATIGTTGMEVKRPGPTGQWVRQGDIAKATQIRSFKCADGTAPDEVFP
jgi:hypothetical protein